MSIMIDKNRQRKYWDNLTKNYKNMILTPFYNQSTKSAFFATLEKIGIFRDNSSDCVPEGINVLELGCGKGYFLPFLYSEYGAGANIIATDFSDKMLASAKKSCKRKQIPIEFASADNFSLPFRDSYFDNVYAINSLLCVDRKERFDSFAEIFRVLKDGGCFCGLLPSNENFMEQAYHLKEIYCNEGQMGETEAMHDVYAHFIGRRYDPIGAFIDNQAGGLRIKLYSSYELEGILANAGFSDITIGRFQYPDSGNKNLGLTHGKYGVYDWLVKAIKQ